MPAEQIGDRTMRENNRFRFTGGAVIPTPEMPQSVYGGWGDYGYAPVDPAQTSPGRLADIHGQAMQNAADSRMREEYRAAMQGRVPDNILEDMWLKKGDAVLQGLQAKGNDGFGPETEEMAAQALLQKADPTYLQQLIQLLGMK